MSSNSIPTSVLIDFVRQHAIQNVLDVDEQRQLLDAIFLDLENIHQPLEQFAEGCSIASAKELIKLAKTILANAKYIQKLQRYYRACERKNKRCKESSARLEAAKIKHKVGTIRKSKRIENRRQWGDNEY